MHNDCNGEHVFTNSWVLLEARVCERGVQEGASVCWVSAPRRPWSVSAL